MADGGTEAVAVTAVLRKEPAAELRSRFILSVDIYLAALAV